MPNNKKKANAPDNERRLRLFLEDAKDYAMILMDTEGVVTEWLGAAESITGWSAKERIGNPFSDIFLPVDSTTGVPEKELRTAVTLSRAEDKRWHIKKNGERFFADGVTTAFRDNDGRLQGFGKIFRDITRQKLSDEALRLSREQFHLLLTSVAECICGVDSDGVCVFINPAGARTLDFFPEEFVGQNVKYFIFDCHPNNLSKDEAAQSSNILRAITQARPLRGDNGALWCKAIDDFLPIQFSVNPMVTDGVNTGAVIAFTDISERRRVEATLLETQRRLRFVMDSAPQKLFTADPSGKLTYVNSQCYKYAGIGQERVEGWAWFKLIHPDDLQLSIDTWRLCIETGMEFELEHRFRRHDGVYHWHLTRALPMRDANGQITIWVGSNTDIHEVKTAEVILGDRLLHEQQNTARLTEVAIASRAVNSLLSAEHIANILAEEARRILRTHQAVVSLTIGTGAAQEINAVSLSHKYAKFRGYKAQPADNGIYAEVRRTNRSMRLTQKELEQHPNWKALGEYNHEHPPMRGWLAVPLVDHVGDNLGIIHATEKEIGDFTEEDEAILNQLAAMASVSIQKARLYESLREQDKRKDEFLATLAHELRNPLAPLRTGLDLLSVSVDEEQSNRVRHMMRRQLTHMVHLVDDLMDVSRVSGGKVELKYERINLRTIMESALEVTEPTIKAARQQLRLQLPEAPLYVRGDSTRLTQVVSNLLNNATKYTLPSGTIRVFVEREGDDVLVRISDTGVGIAQEMLSKVFDLFTQVDPSIDRTQGGLGIGLSLVQKLVDLHGGKVWAESPGLGQGSTFIVRLPLLEEENEKQVTSESGSQQAAIEGKRLLIVDDNVDAAEALAMLLRFFGHTVKTAHSGLEGVDAAKSFLPDAAILDLGLPGLDGYEVAIALRNDSKLKGTVLVALTGWGNQEDRRRSQAAGFDAHLVKPVDAATVLKTLEEFFHAE